MKTQLLNSIFALCLLAVPLTGCVHRHAEYPRRHALRVERHHHHGHWHHEGRHRDRVIIVR